MAGKTHRRHKRNGNRTTRQRTSRSELAYHGTRYQTEELIETLFRAEVGIYEAYVMTDRRLTDQAVVDALTQLIDELANSRFPAVRDTLKTPHGTDEELVRWCLTRQWQSLYETRSRPTDKKHVGVLRTVLGSIQAWSSPGPRSKGYVTYLEGFLTRKMGVSVRQCDLNLVPIPEPEPDELLRLGRAWAVDGDMSAVDEFCELAEGMLADDRASDLIATCQRLIGESDDDQTIADLSRFSMIARRFVVAAMG